MGTSLEQAKSVMKTFDDARLGRTGAGFSVVEESAYAGFGEAPQEYSDFGFNDGEGGDEGEDTMGFGGTMDGGIAEDEAAYLAPIPIARQQELESVYLSMAEAAEKEAEAGPTALSPLKVAEDTYMEVDGSSVAPVAVYLSPCSMGTGPMMSLTIVDKSSAAKGEKKVPCLYAGTVLIFPPYVPPALGPDDLGKRVTVQGYQGSGILQFFGDHKKKAEGVHCGA